MHTNKSREKRENNQSADMKRPGRSCAVVALCCVIVLLVTDAVAAGECLI